ncbi:MAG TPA: DUF3300 domain-containing protein [Verrucomicrobiae bacterium]|nr:DUF3300 domain-containing protein [Verrucomicrobiae bacterium]
MRQKFDSIRKQLLVPLLIAALGGAALFAQDAPPQTPPPDQTLSPDQLDDLVAPIALYPDPLLSQVLVASTYPLEVVQAFQWLQKNPGLTGPALTQAVQQQNWDPSIQALVVVPDVIKRLNDDITWTTNLGNAFLAQQQDVMSAVQRMRLQAQQAGKLASSPQENVTTENHDGQPYIDIEPADPDIIYVPAYDPVWIWGAPRWYPYPHWIWPPRSVIVGGLGFGFYGGINFGFYFGAGWGGWGGWGWHPVWWNHTVVVNNTFIHRYNFNTVNIHDVHGTAVWTHDVDHRHGVPYSNARVQQQFRAPVRQNIQPRETTREAPRETTRQTPQPSERMGNRQVPQNQPASHNRTVFSGSQNSGAAAREHADHGYSSMGPARSSGGGRPAGGGGGARPAPAGGGRGGRK